MPSDTLLPTAKRRPSYDVTRLHIALHGRPKIGKSSWAADWPSTLFLATERGLEYLEVAEKPIDSWPHLLSVVDVFGKGGHPYKTLAIDTMDLAVAMARDYVCEEAGEKYESDGVLGYGKGVSMVAMNVERLLRKLSMLPYGVILISHTEQKTIKRKAGVEIQKAQPTMHDKVLRVLLGWVDMILYMDQDEVVGSDGKLHEVRVLRTAASPYYEAGDRTKCLPETIVVPETGQYAAFIKALKGEPPSAVDAGNGSKTASKE